MITIPNSEFEKFFLTSRRTTVGESRMDNSTSRSYDINKSGKQLTSVHTKIDDVEENTPTVD